MDEVIEAMYNLLRKLRKEEDGQSLVMVALLLTVLLGFSALVIDVGTLYVTKAQLQSAADAGALAGAAVPVSDTVTEAKKYARANGVDDTVSGTTITVDPNVTVAKVPVNTGGSKYTPQELADIKAELIADLNQETDARLMEMANGNAVTTGLSIGMQYKYTAAQITAIPFLNDVKNNDSTVHDLEIINLAKKEGIYDQIQGYVKQGGSGALDEFQNKNDRAAAIAKMKSELQKIKIPGNTIISDKTALVGALANKMVAEIGEEVLEVYASASSRVAVTVAKKVTYTFARILGLTDSTVSAYAVAERDSWNGEALPFINLDGKAESSVKGQALSAWNKVGPGDKERISNDDLVVASDNSNIKVNYEDGITFKKGKVMSKITGALDNMLVVGKTVYLFSLKESEMSKYAKSGPMGLKNKFVIPLADVVLLECKVTEWDGKIVSLEFENYYNYNSSSNTFLSNTGTSPSGSPKLVE